MQGLCRQIRLEVEPRPRVVATRQESVKLIELAAAAYRLSGRGDYPAQVLHQNVFESVAQDFQDFSDDAREAGKFRPYKVHVASAFHSAGAEVAVKRDRRLVPIEDAPLEVERAGFDGMRRDMRHHPLPVASPAHMLAALKAWHLPLSPLTRGCAGRFGTDGLDSQERSCGLVRE